MNGMYQVCINISANNESIDCKTVSNDCILIHSIQLINESMNVCFMCTYYLFNKI